MSSKTKIVVIKLKDILFYATIVILCIIVLLLLYILFQPDTAATSSTIDVKIEHIDSPVLDSYL
jgi:hypothetical protein